MPNPLILEAITTDPPRTLGMLEAEMEGDQVVVGREQIPGGIQIPSSAASREHGVFMGYGSQWVYKDLESTNGSWLNGKRVEPGALNVVRAGDALQFGDIGVRLVEVADSSRGWSSAQNQQRVVLVFSRGQFFKEFPVPPFGRALSVGGAIGGAKADLEIDSYVDDLPSLVIEGRGEHVSAIGVSPRAVYFINGEQKSGNAVVRDRDEIRIAHYKIYFSDPGPMAAASSSERTVSDQADYREGESSNLGGRGRHPVGAGPGFRDQPTGDLPNASQASTADDWITVPRTKVKIPFGQGGSGDVGAFETTAISTAELEGRLAGAEIHPAMRGTMGERPPDNTDQIEDRVILVIGGLLLLAVLVMFLLWLIL